MKKKVLNNILSFFKKEYENLEISDPIEIKGEVNIKNLPKSAGAYILYAEDENFIYPEGKSPIFYIGMSKNLGQRIKTHIKFTKEACLPMDERNSYLYWPRYEYAAKYKTYLVYIKTWQGKTPKSLEDDLLALFARKYFAFPIANGLGSWNKIYQLFCEKFN